jgi:putative MATE family efflux protein
MLKQRRRFSSIVAIALPVMIQEIVRYVMTMTDQAFIGHYRVDGLSAVSSGISPFWAMMSVFMAFGEGVTIMASQARGAKRGLKTARLIENAFFFHQIVGVFYFAFWMALSTPVMDLMGTHGAIRDMGASYIRILSVWFLWTGVTLACNSLFASAGNTMPLMVSAVTKSLLNILLDWLLIFGNWGFPEMGIAGAAWATVISDFVGTALIFGVFLAKRKTYGVSLRGILRPKLRYYLHSMKIGVPAGLEWWLWSLGQTVLVLFLNKIGTLEAGFYNLMNNLLNVSVAIYQGFGVAATVLVGQATGAKRPREAFKIGNAAMGLSQIITALTGILLFAFPRQILSLFDGTGAVLVAMLSLIPLMVVDTVPKCVNVVIGSAVRGRGEAAWLLFTQIVGTTFIILISALFLFVLKWGLWGMVLANIMDESLRAAMNYLKFAWPIFKLKRAAGRVA